jgi:hypothetical protein
MASHHPGAIRVPDPHLVASVLATWLSVFRPCFTAPVWQRVLFLVAGAVLAPGNRDPVRSSNGTSSRPAAYGGGTFAGPLEHSALWSLSQGTLVGAMSDQSAEKGSGRAMTMGTAV